MVSRRRSARAEKERGSRLEAIRDVVEIVAIVAAGAWAFYTFVYENQIKPSQSQPELQVTSSLTRLGMRDGLIAVASHLEVKNVGVTDVWLYGIAETIVGARVRPSKSSGERRPAANAFEYLDESGWSENRATRVYAFAFLTKLADRGSRSSLNLRVGVDSTFDRVFYVAAGRYDVLRSYASIHYGADAKSIPFRLDVNDQGIVQVDPSSGESTDGLYANVAALSLWH